jgi:photosystem II stability/assembly factor-like uncharacterized protein
VTRSGDIITYDVLTASLGWALVVSTAGADSQYWVFRTTDAAKHWQLQLKGQFARTLGITLSIQFFDQTHGFVAVGYPIALYRTVDGGLHWVPVALSDAEAAFVNFSDSRHGWLLVSTPGSPDHPPHLFATADAGDSWQQLPNPPPDSIRMAFRSPSEGWLWTTSSGPSHLYSSVDAGQSWQSHDPPELPGRLSGENTAVINMSLLPGKGVVTYLAVVQGSGFTLPVYEFTSFDLGGSWRFVPMRPNQLFNSEGFEDSVHWWAIDRETLYKSSDAGQTWSKVSTHMENGQFWSYFVHPLDSKHAWAQLQIGEGTGLAITSDGGLTWTRVEVPQPA